LNLGHYNLGDYHFFSRIRSGAHSLGEMPSDRFLTQESFLSLVTSVHESYHVFQGLVGGAGCAVVDAEDHFTNALREAVNDPDGNAWTRAGLLSTGAAYLRRHFYRADESEYLFDQAHRHAPALAETFDNLSQLTTANLLECHAAIYTEIYLSGLMAFRPESFNPAVVTDLEATFRVEQMQALYRLPLDRFREMMKWAITPAGFDRAGQSHRLYRLCPNIAEYTLLAFLLDYSLHISPPLVEEVAANHDTYQEDFDPPVRFAKLLEALLADLSQAQLGVRSPELPEINLHQPYAAMPARLAKWIDIGDLLARSEADGVPPASVPRPQALFPLRRNEIVRAVKLDDPPVTFREFSDVTDQWLELYRTREPLPELSQLTATRIGALEIRAKEPDVFSSWRPLRFFTAVGLPSFNESKTGFHAGVAPSEIAIRMEKSSYDSTDVSWQRFRLVVAQDDDEDEDFVNLNCHLDAPEAFLEKVIHREILFRLSQAIISSAPMKCVLATDRFLAFPCEGRNPQCAEIRIPEQFPPSSACLACALHERYLKGTNTNMPEQVLTQRLVDECAHACESELLREFDSSRTETGHETLHMEATAILTLLAWKVLTPFFVSLSAGVTAAAINAKRIKDQNVKGLKEMIQERIGQKIQVDPARIEESVLLVEEFLEPFDIDRDKARKIVDVLIAKVQDSTEGGAKPVH